MPTEFEWIARIRAGIPDAAPGVEIGPGDDCAAVEGRAGFLTLLTVDALVDGRHFERSWIDPEALGRRLVAINVSDIAAMGGVPRWGLLSLVVPQPLADPWIEGIGRGAAAALHEFGAALVGGNLSGTGGALVADLALVGEVERERVLRRSAALPGDVIGITGDLGAAAMALAVRSRAAPRSADEFAVVRRHIEPRPRVAEGRALSAAGGVGAAIDVSDGLLADLGHLCAASGVGAEVEVARVPISESARTLAARMGVDAEALALAGGEDYELLFTARAEAFDAIARSIHEATGTPVRAIGRVVERDACPRVRAVGPDGLERTPPDGGWDHFREGRPR